MKKRNLCTISLLLAGMTLTGTALADKNAHNGLKSNTAWFSSWYSNDRHQTADVAGLFSGANSGAATIVRGRNSISGRIMSQVPEASLPYTVWLIVVNNPDACLDFLCLLGPNNDPGRPETRTTTFNATASIAAANGAEGGVVNADFEVEAGRLPEGLFILEGSQHALRRGNGHKALVWLVIDQHPAITDGGSWIKDLTETDAPGGDRVQSITLTVFPPCPDSSCPEPVPLADILFAPPP